MNLDYQEMLPEDFAPDSRVWIYQCNRVFTLQEALNIEDQLKEFTENWKSHGDPVKGYANLFFGQFIVLIADERATGVSGCSTDSSVRMIKDIEQLYNVHLFDRQLLAFVSKERVQLIPMQQLNYAVENSFITGDSLYFNNTVQNLSELKDRWLIPVKDSWLAKRVSFTGIAHS